jgi:hypothetical protein
VIADTRSYRIESGDRRQAAALTRSGTTVEPGDRRQSAALTRTGTSRIGLAAVFYANHAVVDVVSR